MANTSVGGVAGRKLSWQLDAVLGADGDVRGSSQPVGAPWTLPDWWRAVGPNGRALTLPVSLLGCIDLDRLGGWSCLQPAGPGTPVEVTIAKLNVGTSLPNGVSSSLPQVVGRTQLDLWVPEANLQAAGGDVTFWNCFATEVGWPNRTIWQPADARGQLNLGGLPEPPGNNCSYVVLPVPTPVPPPRPRPPQPPAPRPRPRPRPAITPIPAANASKLFTPYTHGAAVTDGSEFAAEVRVQLSGAGTMPSIVACDKWDNSTHTLRDGGVSGTRVWWQTDNAAPSPAEDHVRWVVEYATWKAAAARGRR